MRTLRATEIFTSVGVKVVAVESVELRHGRTGGGNYVYAKLKPIAVVVCSRQGAHALDMKARAADTDRLREQVPELDSLVEAFRNETPSPRDRCGKGHATFLHVVASRLFTNR